MSDGLCACEVCGDGEAAGGGFLVEAGEVVAGFEHGSDDLVEGDAVAAIGEPGVHIRVHCAGGGEGIALDAGDLDEAANRVARQAEVVFKAHFGGILDLVGRAAEDLVDGCGGHGAGHADFALAADFRATDGGVFLDDGADEPGGGEGADDAPFGDLVVLIEVVEDGGEDAGTAAGGGCDDEPGAGGILFRDG